jgi:hypothetical protein
MRKLESIFHQLPGVGAERVVTAQAHVFKKFRNALQE